ncbi:unnamed protein product, partial [marine sediment metagenome]
MEEKKISPGVVIVGGLVLGAGAALGAAYLLTRAAPPGPPPPPPPGTANLYGLVTNAITGDTLSGVPIAIDGLYDVTEYGYFAFTELELKRYTGTVTAEGYEPYSIDIVLDEERNYELDIALVPETVPPPEYPEVDQATCPYCSDTFYAPKALEKLFEHVLEK